MPNCVDRRLIDVWESSWTSAARAATLSAERLLWGRPRLMLSCVVSSRRTAKRRGVFTIHASDNEIDQKIQVEPKPIITRS